ncbi:hypothetical protein [Anatilimnocola floriformis]|uniref:hypothetical protein n=1 Tax=Anatilimnocola floriformis TaxID=2948575 RepID=UPI0020C25D63|nr:hypothetical protein [Anatilimnocola floriformis]
MDQSSEISASEMSLIRSQMDETRSALTEKLELLEQKVTDTVQGTVQTVQGTVQQVGDTVENVKAAFEDTVNTVKSTVQDSVDTVKTSVRDTMSAVGEALSISHHVEQHPWAMVAGATAVGFIGGYMLMRPSENARADEKFRHLAASQGRMPQSGYTPQEAFTPEPVQRNVSREPAREIRTTTHRGPSVPEWLQPAATQVQSLAVGAALGLLKDMLVRAVPKPMAGQVTEIVDGLTTSLGGQVYRGSLLDQSASKQ